MKRPFIVSRRSMVLLLPALLMGGLGACSSIAEKIPDAPKPWVKPYERQNLADEIMSAERFPLDSGFMTHLYDSREGSRGADGGGGGGCGCN